MMLSCHYAINMKVVITMVMVFCCCCHELSSLGVVYFSLYITYVLLLSTKKK